MEIKHTPRTIFDKLLGNTSIFRGGGKASTIYKEDQKCFIRANNKTKSLDLWFKIDSKGGGQTKLMIQIGMDDLTTILHRAMEIDYQEVSYAIERAKDNIRIETLGLSARSFTSLDRAGIKYFGELVNMSHNEIKNIKNLGRKSYAEIMELLKEYSSQMEIDRQNGLLKILDGAMEIDRQGVFDIVKDKTKTLTIDSLGFSARTFNTLYHAKVLTLGELADMTENKIKNIKNLEKTGLDEITEVLKEYGL